MKRTGTTRLVAIAVVLAFVFALVGMPVTTGAAPLREGLRQSAFAPTRSLAGLRLPKLRSGVSAAAADDNIPGVLQTPPFTVSDTLDTSTYDYDDVFRVYLSAGDHLVATMTISAAAEAAIVVFGPGATDIYDDTPIDGADAPGVLSFHAPAPGYYYLDVGTWAETWSGSYTLEARLIPKTADDDIPGVDKSLPCTFTDSLDALDPIYAPDRTDTYRIYLNRGDRLVAMLTADLDAVDMDLYGPTATSVWWFDPVAVANTAGVLSYYAPVTGYYYLGVYTYAPFVGPYTVEAQALPPSATSISIRTSAASTRIGGIPILAGAVTPTEMIGRNIVVWVKKPGKSYYSYSSNRTVYNLGGKAAWQYKYYFKPGMVKGYYYFKASAPAPGFASSIGFLTSTSGVISIRLR